MFAGSLAGFPGPYQNQFMGPGADRRRQYYADYASISTPSSGRGGGSRPDVPSVTQAVTEYPDHYAGEVLGRLAHDTKGMSGDNGVVWFAWCDVMW